MKKRSKAFVLSLAAAVLLILLPLSSAFTVQAEEPATFSVKYFSGRGWRCQPGAEFVDSAGDADLGYLHLYLKDGDLVIIYPGDDPNEHLDLGTAKLSNLTIHQGATAIVKTGGVKDCYVLAGAYCAINGDVTNAYLYDSVTCNFNNNVLDMTLYIDYSGSQRSSIGCLGTIGRFYVHSLVNDSYVSLFYNVKTGGSIMQDGTFCIPSDKYSPTPTEEYTKAMENASAPAAPAPSTPAPAAPADEYDKVPKTGDSTACLWLYLASAVFGIGGFALWKKTN